MPVMQAPTGRIEFSDPNNVPELFVNGPISILNMGGLMQLVFTTVRPNPNDLFRGSQAAEFRGTITCRLLMPVELAQQMVRIVGENLIQKAQATTGETGHA